ncbi:flagellin N-terminal-like domain-containing protein [Halogeometricum pallidum JCM 14848]|uniref:Flagellin N-terminal-like domain-containing protein n=1 Tax=Halogeometricum pallidum JCM 14848 TaxID=1227487 RepID=M0DJ36_HALPD|nr:flagellin N-terminal-like domain-containing protein [Halogeometricum pallidum JCM 14848]
MQTLLYVHVDGGGSDAALRPICEAGQRYFVVVTRADGSTLRMIEILREPTSKSDDC